MSEERASSANGSTIGDNARALVMVAAIVFVLASLLMPQLVWPFFIAFGITSALIWSLTPLAARLHHDCQKTLLLPF
ncbi:MAG: hypothetical protein AAFX96_09530, partial [Pseudomonadota bacterium]